VLLESQVTHIVLSLPKGKTLYVATGVNFTSGGEQFFIKAHKEVILSAGYLKTPQLLELSGIGNKTLLSQLNITTLIDLPQVGENLQDHLLIGSDFILKEPAPLTWDALRFNATLAQQQALQYATNHTGLLASTNSAFSFHPLQAFAPRSKVKALVTEAAAHSAHTKHTPLQRAQYEIQSKWLLEGQVGQIELALVPGGGAIVTNVPIIANASYVSIVAALAHPFSRGSVHIDTTDGIASPVIDPNYLSHPFDLQALVLATQLVRKISETAPLAALIDRPSTPPANVTSDADFTSYLKAFVDTVYHPAGTAALAPRDLGGVVNNQLIVYGTLNLRVVDASIIPLHIAAHPQSTVYAIAEMAADIIKSN